ncbi:NADP-dependent oxidoreductase [Streptomyces sp. NPDC004539]|uniref:NADP-dependent oxidoreductase n=1 Tax=Streptomyces sp. NPDC004539 TaxID=3154280 RepID=UPI0033B6D359
MQGYVLTKYGNADVMELREVPKPVAGPGDLLIRVRAAGLNPVDYKIREGQLKVIHRLALPTVAGSELAGVVEEVGAGVEGFAVGDRVMTRVDPNRLGALATYAVVSAGLVAPMPEKLDFDEAAGLPLAGLTALQALRDEMRVRPGQRIFISGGAGGVGTLAIQLAVWMGAHVTTTASPAGAELVRSLGAEEVIDYKSTRFKDVLRDMDGALDLVGGQDLTDSFGIVRPGTTVVSVGGVPEPLTARKDLDAGFVLASVFAVMSAKPRRQAKARGVGYRFLMMRPSGTDLRVLADLVEQGHVRPVVDRGFPLERAADAFAYLETGRAKGKVIVRMP